MENLRQLKLGKQLNKQRIKDYGTGRLIDAGHSYTSYNDGLHLVINSPRCLVDYWPSTGKWRARDSPIYFRGINSLLDFLEDGNWQSLLTTEPED